MNRQDWLDEGAECVATISDQRCDRCEIQREFWRWDSDDAGWYWCPCCRSRLRTAEQIAADSRRHMAELDMTEDEYDAHCRSMVGTVSDAALKAAQKHVAESARTWQPACPHDIKNPWRDLQEGRDA